MKKGYLIAIIAMVWAAAFYLYDWKGNRHELVLSGNIEIRSVNLGFQAVGQIEHLHKEEGEAVKAGDLLAEIDRRVLQAEVDRAQETVNTLDAAYGLASLQYERYKNLFASEAISQGEYDQFFFSFKSALSRLEEAKAGLALARIHLENTRLASPSPGVILTRVREPGTVVKAGDVVYVLALTTPVWARAYISERDLGRVRLGMEAEVVTDTASNPIYKGRVGFISPTAEFTPKNVETADIRTDLVFQVRIMVEGEGLLQGMPVTVRLKPNDQNPERR